MIQRNLLKYLNIWKNKANRKPLVLRGARQVGKSSLVRAFAKESFEAIAEFNFEDQPDDAELFIKPRSRSEALKLLSARLRMPIVPGKTLLFLDEIQARPELLAELRYWHEEFPELHVIAAGSLLEFALQNAAFSMPVGRIEFAFLGPCTFGEFLCAVGDADLQNFLETFQLGDTLPLSIHTQLLRRMKDFWIVGGMPESVSVFAKEASYIRAEEIKRSIVSTYQDDFGKYGKKINYEVLRKVYRKIPIFVGKRVKFVEYSTELPAHKVMEVLDRLCQSKVATRVLHSNAQGLPLGASGNEKFFKHIFVDIGLQLSLCDLDPLAIEASSDPLLVNQGALAEQFIGQHLMYLREPFIEPELYYWERTKRNASAEIDYLLGHQGQVLPIEVKSGSTGHMQSLQVFLRERQSPLALRFYAGLPTQEKLSLQSELLSLPLYFVEQTKRLLGN